MPRSERSRSSAVLAVVIAVALAGCNAPDQQPAEQSCAAGTKCAALPRNVDDRTVTLAFGADAGEVWFGSVSGFRPLHALVEYNATFRAQNGTQLGIPCCLAYSDAGDGTAGSYMLPIPDGAAVVEVNVSARGKLPSNVRAVAEGHYFAVLKPQDAKAPIWGALANVSGATYPYAPWTNVSEDGSRVIVTLYLRDESFSTSCQLEAEATRAFHEEYPRGIMIVLYNDTAGPCPLACDGDCSRHEPFRVCESADRTNCTNMTPEEFEEWRGQHDE